MDTVHISELEPGMIIILATGHYRVDEIHKSSRDGAAQDAMVRVTHLDRGEGMTLTLKAHKRVKVQ